MEERGNPIRITQLEIEGQLENFPTAPDTIFVKTSYVCDNVRDHILNYADEPHLSKTQNNHRRIFIASELFNSFCGIFAHVVDYEYAKIVRDIMQWDKYKRLSRKITAKTQLELRREKYFLGEAQSKLLKSLEDTRVEGANEVTPTDTEERDFGVDAVTRHERESLPPGPEQVEGPGEAITHQEINETLAPPSSESSFRNELPSNITGNMTEIRGAIADATHLDLVVSPVSRQELSLPNIDAETSIRPPAIQRRTDEDDIDRILQILEDENFPKETVDIEEPAQLEPTSKSPEPVVQEIVPENQPADGATPEEVQAVPSESSEGWSLPSIEEVEKTRRKHRYLIIDRATTIPDYAARALQLNRNISIQRVQVFEGPPSVLQAISANHLMTTPGHKNSLFRDVRSSKLSTLYNRHLEVEKRPVEETLLQRRPAEQRDVDISRVRANTEIMETVGMRTGMHSRAERSDVLVDVPEKGQPPELDIPAVVAPPKESLVGVAMSRIINSTIEPPEEGQMERINAVPDPIPSVQQLQGKSLDRRTSPPWFISTKENPPSEKYREFNYVYDRLQMYWSMLENQGMEKRISIREFFSFEADGSVADFLTVLRIVDKMSIQRKLLLEYKRGDVVVRPFEVPYVSDVQLLLKEKEPVL